MTRYRVYITPTARQEARALPGYVRQRVVRSIGALADQPRPTDSSELHQTELPVELRRIRLLRWRILYIVSDGDQVVDVLAVRRRPPYDYGDLSDLLKQVG